MTSHNETLAESIQEIADRKLGRNEDLMWETFASVLRKGEPVGSQLKIIQTMIEMKVEQLSALTKLQCQLVEHNAGSAFQDLLKEILSRKPDTN